MIRLVETYHRIEPVSELRTECRFDRRIVFRFASRTKSHHIGFTCPDIGCHDDNDIFEIGAIAGIVRQHRIVHHLQEYLDQIRMRLFDLVEQQYRMRMLTDRLGQLPALLVADIARRSTDESADGMFLHIFAHVERHSPEEHR